MPDIASPPVGGVPCAPEGRRLPEPRKTRSLLRRLKHALRARRRARSANRPLPAVRVRLGEDPVEVHSLACSRDVPMSLWSLAGFVAFTGLRPRVVVHDDGTLTPEDRDAYARSFEGIEVLEAARTDALAARALAAYPTCAAFRADPRFYCGRKLFDVLFVARRPHVLLLDSDVLFFRRPDHLLDAMAAGRPCFNSDYQSSYGASPDTIDRWFGREVLRRVNAGLLHVPVEGYRARLPLVERYLAFARDSLDERVNKHEQTSHALLMTELSGERLPSTYQLDGPIDAETVSHHFVNDGRQRDRFWYRGVNRIRREVGARLTRRGAG